MTEDFKRSNVNESMLDVTPNERSTFDMYHKVRVSLPIGKYIPVNVQSLTPTSVVVGSITPDLTLEVVGTPEIGPTRLDTHTIAVNMARINHDWPLFFNQEDGYDRYPQVDFADVFAAICQQIFGYNFGKELDSDLRTAAGGSLINRHEVARYFSSFLDQIEESDIDSVMMLGDHVPAWRQHMLRVVDNYPESIKSAEFVCLLFDFLKPWFGEDSILDYCRYPVLNYYGNKYTLWRAFSYADGSYSAFSNQEFQQYTPNGWAGLYRLYKFDGGFVEEEVTYSNECMLRACYCAWYDSLRNWHIEQKKYLPNPDLWRTPTMFNLSEQRPIIDWKLCLRYLTPFTRCWGSDPITSVQTDDIFRHVFNPIFARGDVFAGNANFTDAADSFDKIYSVIIGGVRSVFPVGIFGPSPFGVQERSLSNDLQTMRRAGWLEKMLARSYYYPDTYEGQMYAQHQVKLSDLLDFSSKYVSGSESFLSGDQQVANVSAGDSVAGERTFTGGLASKENLSFACNSNHVFLVTFASIMPIPEYDSIDPHIYELGRDQLPNPVFSGDTRVQIKAHHLMRSMDPSNGYMGYVPAYYPYRCMLDSIHGKFLREYRSQLWIRDWYSVYGQAFEARVKGESRVYFDPNAEPFALTPYNMHVHVNLDAFNGSLTELDGITYGKIEFNLSVQNDFQAAVEHI